MMNEVQSFLDELDELCKKYNMSISHKDGWGGFIIEEYDPDNIDWLKEAKVNIK